MTSIDLNKINSIHQTHQASSVSDKYSFIPTTRVLDVLQGKGWAPVQADEVKTRKEAKRGFQKHLIRLRNEDVAPTQHNGEVPEIVLTNSHDGGASFCLMSGIFRIVCSNGLIVADSMVQCHRIKHIGYTDDAVIGAMNSIVEDTPRVFKRIGEFSQIDLDAQERRAFADSSLRLLYDDEALKKKDMDETISRLLTPRRVADQVPTLWNTFNNIQEKFVNGSKFLTDKIDASRRSSRSRVRKTRAIKSIDNNVRLNRALWELTEKMAELKDAKN